MIVRVILWCALALLLTILIVAALAAGYATPRDGEGTMGDW